MTTSNVILSYLNHVKDGPLAGFPIENIFVFDESMDFSERAVQYITRKGPYQKLEGTPPDAWVIIIWNRGSLTTSDLNRAMMVTVAREDDPDRLEGEAKFRMAKLTVDMKFITNSIELAETMEEYLHVLSGEPISFEFSLPRFGTFRASADGETSTEFEKQEISEYGSLTSVSLSTTLNYPIILPVNVVPDILTINPTTTAFIPE